MTSNEAADAVANCEAVTRPSMGFVPVKTNEQQAALAMHSERATTRFGSKTGDPEKDTIAYSRESSSR